MRKPPKVSRGYGGVALDCDGADIESAEETLRVSRTQNSAGVTTTLGEQFAALNRAVDLYNTAVLADSMTLPGLPLSQRLPYNWSQLIEEATAAVASGPAAVEKFSNPRFEGHASR